MEKTNFKSRKLQLALLFFIVGTAFCWFGKITSAEWVSLTQWLGGLYILGNVGASVATKLGIGGKK